jgi:hypothetical protein
MSTERMDRGDDPFGFVVLGSRRCSSDRAPTALGLAIGIAN